MSDDSREKIAVVGMAGRFPGARDVDAFWSNLVRGEVSIARLTEEELLEAGVTKEQLEGSNWVRAMGVVSGADEFDAQFFSFSPREAAELDPQQRLFLECAWEAFENASACGDGASRSVGVFGGTGPNMYLLNNIMTNARARQAFGPLELLYANSVDFLTTRVSHRLGLNGPSVAVQTACSSSLVAIHLAMKSLLTYECDLALAGGVGIHPPQKAGYRFEPGSILSPDGVCRPFDRESRGMVPGNGVGVVVLKRLSDALADRDTIHAVVLGSAVGNDGADRVGYTAPGLEGQAQVIETALALADVPAESIGYIEAHGTGTPLGDPIEVGALRRAYARDAMTTKTTLIGSVKANIGHLNTAAGVAGFIKATHVVREGVVPPLANFRAPNPALDLDASPFTVNAERGAFLLAEGPRRAAVSSFGIGGTNAHVILEEPPTSPERASSEGAAHALVLSAKTPRALDAATERLASFLDAHPSADLRDVAHSLRVGRRVFEHRRVVVAANVEDAAKALRSRDAKRVRTGAEARKERRVAFVFPGQGSQHPKMAPALYRTSEAFRRELDACCAVAREALREDLRALILGDGATAARELEQTRIAQPALFAVEYALARALQALGVEPSCVAGHSIGEYAAACIAGVFERDDAMRLVIARGALMQAAPAGAMLAVPLSMRDLEPLLGAELDVAAINGPEAVVVAGPVSAVNALADRLAARAIESKRLRVSHAFHSRVMTEASEAFASAFHGVKLAPPTLPIASVVTGGWLSPERATSVDYWCTQIRKPVLFQQALATVLADREPVVLEVGPGQALTAAARHLRPVELIPVLPSARAALEGESDASTLATALGQLWLAGAAMDVEAFGRQHDARRTPLPTYPFERRRHWIEPGISNAASPSATTDAPLEADKHEDTAHAPKGNRPPLDVPLVAPRTPTESIVARAWAAVLGVEPVGVDDDFFELGGDSLIAIRLASRLRADCRVELPIGLLSRATTVAAVAREVDAASSTGAGAAEARSFAITVPLPDDVRPTSQVDAKRDDAAWEHVLLTGATGFLGAFLLNDLLSQTRATIHCAVRAASPDDALARIRKNLTQYALWDEAFASRVIAFDADLLTPGLGLSPDAYVSLARRIDVVFHAGAWVNFTIPYERLAPTNVGGTIEMLRFAVAERTKPFHFVSTAAVVPDALSGRVSENDPLDPPVALHTGYAESKWVAERLVAEAARRGVPTAIHRPATVSGHSETGHSNTTDLVSSLIKGVIQLGSAPDIDGHLYATPANIVARAIVSIARRAQPDGRVHNLTPDAPITFREIFRATKDFGFDVEIVPPATWRDALLRAASDPAATALYPFLGLIEGGSNIGRTLLANENTHRDLRGTPLEWRDVSSTTLMGALGHWVEIGFLPPPSSGEI